MATDTKTRNTSYHRLTDHARNEGWTITETEMPIKVKAPKPENDSYRRRRYVPMVEVPGVEVLIDNGVTSDGSTWNNTHVRAYFYFTADGKFVQHLTRGEYPFYNGRSLAETMQAISDRAPAKVQALIARRQAEREAAHAKRVNEAEDRVIAAQNALDQAKRAAVVAVSEFQQKPAVDLDAALDDLAGPLMNYGLCKDAREQADQHLAHVMQDGV